MNILQVLLWQEAVSITATDTEAVMEIVINNNGG